MNLLVLGKKTPSMLELSQSPDLRIGRETTDSMAFRERERKCLKTGELDSA